jgi:hypothetical protein
MMGVVIFDLNLLKNRMRGWFSGARSANFRILTPPKPSILTKNSIFITKDKLPVKDLSTPMLLILLH